MWSFYHLTQSIIWLRKTVFQCLSYYHVTKSLRKMPHSFSDTQFSLQIYQFILRLSLSYHGLLVRDLSYLFHELKCFILVNCYVPVNLIIKDDI